MVVAYNTDTVVTIPTGYKDLLDKRHHGRIGHDTPEASGSILYFMGTLLQDADFGEEFLTALAKNSPQIQTSTKTTQRIASGELDIAKLPVVEAVLAGEEGTVKDYTDELGRRVFGSYMPIRELGWGVLIQRPLADIAAEVGQLRTTIILVMIAAVLLVVPAGWLMSRQIAKPIGQLASASERVARGDLSTSVDVRSSNEVGVLAHSFNEMIVALKKSRDELEQRAEKTLRERVKELTCLYAISQDMRRQLPIDELCRRITEHLVPAMQFPEIAVSVLELDDRRFTSERYAEGLSHGLHAELRVRGEVRGRLWIYYTEERPFLIPEEQNLVNIIGEDLGLWLERKRAEEELERSYEALQRTLEGTVHTLASVAEKRDPYTAGHQERVSQLACAIAEQMGLPEEQIAGIRVAGTLHDIGKIYIPAEILNKPGRLTELEFAMIRTHPQVGHGILKTIEFPWPVAQIVLQHHERMDGSGYPLGLSGEDILLEARILAVADVFEAMSSHRPYRPAHSKEETLEELRSNAGVKLDPKVVEAFLSLLAEGVF